MRKYRIGKAGQTVRRGAKYDNVVLASANLLAFKAQWQRVANSLAQGAVLVVLPPLSRHAAILERVAAELRKIGRIVTTMSAGAHELVDEG
jgi:hypothetical protein